MRFVVPVHCRKRVIQEAHNSVIAGHGGYFRTRERIRAEMWWPGMDQDIEDHVKACTVCARCTKKGVLPTAPLQQLPLPTRPAERVHVDLYGPLKNPRGKKNFICTITDAFTKMVALAAVEQKTAQEVTDAIYNNWITIYGVPDILVSDNGLEFANDISKRLWEKLGVDHRKTAPYHPQANAQVERFNHTMHEMLVKMLLQAEKSTADWEAQLRPLAWANNTAVSKATMSSPFYTMFGYDPNIPLWPEGNVMVEEDPTDNPKLAHKTNQQLARQAAHGANQHSQLQTKKQHEKAHKTHLHIFKPGEKVWAYIRASNAVNRKNHPNFEMATIVKQISLTTYLVHRGSRKRKVKTHKVNIKDLKPYTGEPFQPQGEPVPEEEEEEEAVQPEREEEQEDSESEGEQMSQEEDDEYRQPAHARPQQDSRRAHLPRAAKRSREEIDSRANCVAALLAVQEEEEWDLFATICKRFKLISAGKASGFVVSRSQQAHQPPPQPAAMPPPPPAAMPPPPPPAALPETTARLARELKKLQTHNKPGLAETAPPTERRARSTRRAVVGPARPGAFAISSSIRTRVSACKSRPEETRGEDLVGEKLQTFPNSSIRTRVSACKGKSGEAGAEDMREKKLQSCIPTRKVESKGTRGDIRATRLQTLIPTPEIESKGTRGDSMLKKKQLVHNPTHKDESRGARSSRRRKRGVGKRTQMKSYQQKSINEHAILKAPGVQRNSIRIPTLQSGTPTKLCIKSESRSQAMEALPVRRSRRCDRPGRKRRAAVSPLAYFYAYLLSSNSVGWQQGSMLVNLVAISTMFSAADAAVVPVNQHGTFVQETPRIAFTYAGKTVSTLGYVHAAVLLPLQPLIERFDAMTFLIDEFRDGPANSSIPHDFFVYHRAFKAVDGAVRRRTSSTPTSAPRPRTPTR